ANGLGWAAWGPGGTRCREAWPSQTHEDSIHRSLCRPVDDRVLVVAVGAGLDALEAVLHALGQAKGARNALLEVVEGAGKDALVHGDARREAPDEALVAVPLVGQVLGRHHVDALKVERARAAVAADDVAGVATRRAVLIIVRSLEASPCQQMMTLTNHVLGDASRSECPWPPKI